MLLLSLYKYNLFFFLSFLGLMPGIMITKAKSVNVFCGPQEEIKWKIVWDTAGEGRELQIAVDFESSCLLCASEDTSHAPSLHPASQVHKAPAIVLGPMGSKATLFQIRLRTKGRLTLAGSLLLGDFAD
jgi:hypothetical protein